MNLQFSLWLEADESKMIYSDIEHQKSKEEYEKANPVTSFIRRNVSRQAVDHLTNKGHYLPRWVVDRVLEIEKEDYPEYMQILNQHIEDGSIDKDKISLEDLKDANAQYGDEGCQGDFVFFIGADWFIIACNEPDSLEILDLASKGSKMNIISSLQLERFLDRFKTKANGEPKLFKADARDKTSWQLITRLDRLGEIKILHHDEWHWGAEKMHEIEFIFLPKKKFGEWHNFNYKWLESAEAKKKSIFVLIGPPSVGKSTWIEKTFAGKDPYIINRDSIVEQIAESMGMTYDEMFVAPQSDESIGQENPKYGIVTKSPAFMTWQPLSYSKILKANSIINDKLKEKISGAINSDKDIIVDMTNMTINARKQALRAIEGKEEDYNKIAVVFNFSGAEEIIKKMSKKRSEEIKAKGGSKTIPENVLDRMMSSFQEVSPSEHFDEIINVDNRELFRKLIDN